MSSTKEFLTSKELSDRWRLSDQTLANWRYAGKGPPFIRVGSRVLYPVEGIRAFELQQQQHPQPITPATA